MSFKRDRRHAACKPRCPQASQRVRTKSQPGGRRAYALGTDAVARGLAQPCTVGVAMWPGRQLDGRRVVRLLGALGETRRPLAGWHVST